MGTMKVSVDAETDDGRCEFEFTWEGADEEIWRVMRRIQAEADDLGVAPEVVSSSVLRYLPKVTKDPVMQQGAMLYILDAVLRQAIPDLDGVRVYEVAAKQDVFADLIVRNNRVQVRLAGQPRAN
jgi:hypothetical protein